MSSYFWNILDQAWHFTLPLFGLGWLWPTIKTRKISFGFWLRYSSEGTKIRVLSPAMENSRIEYIIPLQKAEGLIRLFILNPGSDDDIVSGRLCYCANWGVWDGSGEPFEALSYTWGESSNCPTILVDDSSVSVTESLEAALRHLRFQDRPRTLWIDYICINQRDVDELSNQVAMMGSIYANATSVIIWLGEATTDSAVGMEVLRHFANQDRPQAYPVWQGYPSSVVMAGLKDIMSRDWFRRMWVVQEVGQSRTAVLTCGRHQVQWQSTDCVAVRRFSRMVKFAEIQPKWEEMGLAIANMQPLLDMLDLQIGNQLDRSFGTTHRTAPDILDVAHSMRHKKCKDPRDKVFGIFGMVSDMLDSDDFTPRYDMTVGEMYEALQRALVW